MRSFAILFLSFMLFNIAHAALNYQQDLIFSSWKSKEDVSKVDDDFTRINGKVFQQKYGLLNETQALPQR